MTNLFSKQKSLVWILLSVAILQFNFVLHAQVIEIKVNEFNPTPLKFNSTFIAVSKIKKVILHISNKPDNMIIFDKGESECYEFDTLGNMIKYYKTSVIGYEQVEKKIPAVYKKGRLIKKASTEYETKYKYDTAFTWFSYDKNKNIIMKRNPSGDFFNTFYYEYDSTGNLLKEIHCKETNKNMDKHHFEPGVQTILSSQKFEYINQTSTQRKIKYYNDDNKVYKEAIINFSDTLVEENYSFIVGYVRYTNVYKYDSIGRLISKLSTSNSNGDVTIQSKYIYSFGSVIEKELCYKNEVNTNDVYYYYDEQKKFLKSILSREYIYPAIEIIKIEYEFY